MRYGQSKNFARTAILALSLTGAAGLACAAPVTSLKQNCAAALSDTDYQLLGTDRYDQLVGELAGLGMTTDAARAALKTLTEAGGDKAWRSGGRVTVARRINPCDADSVVVEAVSLTTDQGAETSLARGRDGAFVLVPAEDRARSQVRLTGTIQDSELGPGLLDGGVPSVVAEQLIDSLASAPEGVLKNARFEVFYDVSATRDGAPIEATLTTATLTIDGRERHIHYYRPTAGRAVEASNDTPSLTPVSFIHPVPEGVFTSGFGWRKHPVLRRQLFHMGVDFSAPRGTPVRAAADGVVREAGRSGNYGRLIRVDHDGRTETVYAHLDGMAKGLRVGAKVKQGDVIGYVGRTGLASGAHLYFEVLVDGKNIDPLSVDPDMRAAAAQAAETDRPLKRFITNVSAEAPSPYVKPRK